jgi:RNA-binding protein 39
MKATEHDIRRYFRKFLEGPKWTVREVILLRDRRTGRHKGGCYVELATSSHVDKALAANGIVPDFQRFPISVKRSEAEKNDFGPYIPPTATGAASYTSDGRRIEAQKVYVGSIDICVTQAQLYALFSGFGALEKVLLQMDTTTGMSKGFAFLSYKDPRDANLAIQTMSGQLLAGKPL